VGDDMSITNNDPCIWCVKTSEQIDSQEAHMEELQAELLELKLKLLAAQEALEHERNL
jgi:hypothetical protein